VSLAPTPWDPALKVTFPFTRAPPRMSLSASMKGEFSRCFSVPRDLYENFLFHFLFFFLERDLLKPLPLVSNLDGLSVSAASITLFPYSLSTVLLFRVDGPAFHF